ncbi:MAG: formylglycine-generating enzyme family protein [Dysgonamonadaceae bacterium]|jgi:formylglycine-generating enzyme required for sulfatase activity|nr:formylglycine-generating enzyme family protein [Dysgonamonadaceae bacterium]
MKKAVFLTVSFLLTTGIISFGQSRVMDIYSGGSIKQTMDAAIVDSIKFRTFGESTASATYTAGVVNFDMIGVQGGTMKLNGTNVTLSSFAIGKTEVTQGLWLAVMGSWPSSSYQPGSYGSGFDYPAYYVSWNDIVGTSTKVGYTINGVEYKTDGFCYKLSKLVDENLSKKFILPTEAQWEYAARGGQQTHGYTYSGSNYAGDVSWNSSNSNNTTHLVASKDSNELGIYDMSGNVWEWCSDWYSSAYPFGTNNPVGAASGSSRVIRGGSWYYVASMCTVSYRFDNTPSYRDYNRGFRLALVP